jgi:phosphohistidine phosphatase
VSRVTVEALYLAEPEEILDAVQREGGGETVLLLGHNPGLEIGATWLAVDLPPLDMPTCAIAVLRFPVAQWQDVTEGQGALLHHVTPKSLV